MRILCLRINPNPWEMMIKLSGMRKMKEKKNEKKRERRNSELTMHAYSIFFDLGESPP